MAMRVFESGLRRHTLDFCLLDEPWWRIAMTLMRKKALYAHGAISSRNSTHLEKGQGFAVILGAISGRPRLLSGASAFPTQVTNWHGEAASVASQWRRRAA